MNIDSDSIIAGNLNVDAVAISPKVYRDKEGNLHGATEDDEGKLDVFLYAHVYLFCPLDP